MKTIIIGLGNPGTKFKNTRHNVGFMAIDKIAGNFQFSIFNFQSIFNAEISEGEISGKKIILVKPQTFMNASGKAVKSLCTKHNIQGADLVIVHDDLDIKLGDYKIQFGKGPKVHNGLLSIKKFLGTQNFWHVRVGIDNRSADNRLSGEAYVLQSFSSSEKVVMDKVVKEVASELTNKLYKGY